MNLFDQFIDFCVVGDHVTIPGGNPKLGTHVTVMDLAIF
jgi:hypothetical protein